MPINTYQMLSQCLAIVHKISRLADLTAISKSTLTKIAKRKGEYEGCLSTQMRLQAFLENNKNRVGRPYKKGEE